MPTVQNLDCGQCETCTVLWSVHFHYLSHIRGICGVEQPQRGLTPRLLLSRVKHGGGSEMVWPAISWYPLLCLMGASLPRTVCVCVSFIVLSLLYCYIYSSFYILFPNIISPLHFHIYYTVRFLLAIAGQLKACDCD